MNPNLSKLQPYPFQRLRDLFQGIKPYVLRTANQALLLVGPFRGASDADSFAQDLETLGVRSSKYINSQTDRIAPLASE